MVIYASFENIDGEGGTLGFARPCNFIVVKGITFTKLEVMSFDSDDVDHFLDNGSFEVTVLHEMGHVLGLGLFWSSFGLVNNQFEYQGSSGNAGYDTRRNRRFSA